MIILDMTIDDRGLESIAPHENVSVTVRELARRIVSVEQSVDIEYATGEPYHNVYTSLIQSHLPRLDAIDAISYDPDRKVIHPGGNLIPIAMVATTTTPLIQLLFHSEVADLYSGGKGSPGDEIPD